MDIWAEDGDTTLKLMITNEVTTSDLIFESIGKLQIDLSQEERAALTTQLRQALGDYEKRVLDLYEVRHYIYEQYNQRKAEARTVATLSQRFNMSIRGRNKEINEDVNTNIKQAFQAERIDDSQAAAYYLRKIQLRYTLLHGKKVKEICAHQERKSLNAQRALVQLDLVEHLRDQLFCSVIKMAAELAGKHRRPLKGSVTHKSDLIQEAILAAKHYVAMYQPTDDGVTFTSYMYNSINYHLSRYLNENTRTVALPRTIIDQYRPVAYAIDKIGMTNIIDLALMSTQILHDLKQRSTGRKLNRDEAYTPDEVAKLLTYVQTSAAIDVEMGAPSMDEGRTSFIGATELPDRAPLQDEKHDEVNGMRLIMGVLSDYCDGTEEYKLMEVRWGQNRVRGLKTTAEVYRRTTGKPMNKGKVAEIEHKVLARIKKGIANGDTRLDEIKKTLEALG